MLKSQKPCIPIASARNVYPAQKEIKPSQKETEKQKENINMAKAELVSTHSAHADHKKVVENTLYSPETPPAFSVFLPSREDTRSSVAPVS
jgi:hypothetical protein